MTSSLNPRNPRDLSPAEREREAIDHYRRELKRSLDLLPRLEALEEDVFDEGSIIAFDVRFADRDGPSQAYTYVALKTTGGWYTTSLDLRRPSTWHELVEFTRRSVDPVVVYHAPYLEPMLPS